MELGSGGGRNEFDPDPSRNGAHEVLSFAAAQGFGGKLNGDTGCALQCFVEARQSSRVVHFQGQMVKTDDVFPVEGFGFTSVRYLPKGDHCDAIGQNRSIVQLLTYTKI